jgi:hypothetical protein
MARQIAARSSLAGFGSGARAKPSVVSAARIPHEGLGATGGTFTGLGAAEGRGVEL